jgi:dTDP-4-amino-4,6-dideoxygalactose transaminase
VAEFENRVSRHVGAGRAVACSNCTVALHLALIVNGIGAGDEVIVPSYTWIATPNAVRMVGAVPVFADIDERTYNVTAESLEAAIGERTKAIMVVHQFGLPCDMDPIKELAEARRLVLIEDAACAIGSTYKGVPVGGLGSMACFSFHPRKLISTGEGGMLTTDDAEKAGRARVLINHGASLSDAAKHKAGSVEAILSEEFIEAGFNYRMTDLQGALGVAQMERLQHILDQRALRAARYIEALRDRGEIIVPYVPSHAGPNWQSFAVRVSEECPASRDTVAQRLLDKGVSCRPAYMMCHSQPIYKGSPMHLPGTEKAFASVIILPLYPQMSDAEQDYVISSLIESVGRV